MKEGIVMRFLISITRILLVSTRLLFPKVEEVENAAREKPCSRKVQS